MNRMEHLTEAELEALAANRPENAGPIAQQHALSCQACAHRLRLATHAITETHALIQAQPALDFDPSLLANTVVKEHLAHAPSARAFQLSLVAGVAVLLGSVWFRVGELPSLRVCFSVLTALAHQITQLLGTYSSTTWMLLTVSAAACATMTLSVVDRLARPASVALLVILVSLPVHRARALDFEGEWPATERVSMDVENVTVSEALRVVTEQVHLNGVVIAVPTDTRVTVHLRDASLQQALSVIVGSAPNVVATRDGGMIRFSEKAAQIGLNSATPPVAPVVAPPPVEAAPKDDDDDVRSSRVSTGSSVVVRAGETVRDAVAVGGSVDVAGHVTGDAVAIGGPLRIRCGGKVDGDTFAMGGHVVRDACADDGAPADAPTYDDDDDADYARIHARIDTDDDDDDESWSDALADDVSNLAFVFVLGVFFLRLSPTRYRDALQMLKEHPVRSWLGGLLAAFAIFAAAIVLTVTIIGIPLALVGLVFGVIAAYLGAAVLASIVGSLIPMPQLRDNPLLELLAGLVACLILFQVTSFAAVAFVFCAIAAFGAVLVAFRRAQFTT